MVKAKPELRPRRFNVYVIELDPAVWAIRKFQDANPNYVPDKPGKPCVYVGMTALTPEERFAKHLAGWKANRYVRKYGRWLRRRLYTHYNPMTYTAAQAREKELAAHLRRRGFGVWQN